VALVNHHMGAIGASRMALPILNPATLWKKSGRWETVGSELFRMKSNTGAECCIGPTHEESVTELVASELTSHRQLPLRLYQVDRKFRDEKRPRGGLLRCKEFWMKDMYTFDVSEEAATATYHEVCEAYESIFRTLSLPVMRVNAATGNIGGSLSHEYHVVSPVGEDTLVLCQSCGRGFNKELLSSGVGGVEGDCLPGCPQTSPGECQLEEVKGIEVAHTFYLGTKYSSLFGASFSDHTNRETLCEMGCFGIGVSRLLQAVVEHSCSVHGSEGISWPLFVTPFTACVLPLTTSPDPSDPLMEKAYQLYDRLSEEACPGHVILDDRTHLTMGARLRNSQRLGYPCTIVIGHKAGEGEYEVRLAKKSVLETCLLTEDQVLQTVHDLYTLATSLD
jgi:prolyl-tRNA synthetase